MDVDGFWRVVERARTAAGPVADQARWGGRPSPLADALVTELMRLPLADIVAFELVFDEVLAQADTWDLCASCWIVEYGFLSDDGFSDFRAGLVGMGRSMFEAVVAEPDLLSRHPAVREISRLNGQHLWIGDEELLDAPSRAYERLTGDDEAFWDDVYAMEPDEDCSAAGPEPAGERWDLRSSEEWQRRLPGLAALFLHSRLQPK